MEDDRTLITIPTELEHGDAFVVLAGGAAVLLVCWWLAQRGVPPVAIAFPVLIASAWMFTSRSATDVRFVGVIAVFTRNKLGERDVHEWILAAAHYVYLVHGPTWRRRLHWFKLWTVGKHRTCHCGGA